MSPRHGGGFVPGTNGTAAPDPRHGGGFVPGADLNARPSPKHGLVGGYTPDDDIHPVVSPTAGLDGNPFATPPDTRYSSQQHVPTILPAPQTPPTPSNDSFKESPSIEQQQDVVVHQVHYNAAPADQYANRPQPSGAPGISSYVLPQWVYDVPGKRRHRDALGRETEDLLDDRFLRPGDSRLKKLTVQATDKLYNNPANTTYRRTYVRNVSPWMLQLAFWATKREGTSGDGWLIALKCFAVFLPMSVMLMFPGKASGEDNGGRYDEFPYRYYGYAKAPRNAAEGLRVTSGRSDIRQQVHPVAERALRPRYLCFINEDGSISTKNIEEWTSKHPGAKLDYLFVAYTTEQFSHDSRNDLNALHKIAVQATRDAKLTAYWVGCSCMPDERHMEEDVYRISDVIRGAKALIIAIGANEVARKPEDMLKQWGSRMWTYPEVLLSPGSTIKVFNRDGTVPEEVPKQHFARTVWADGTVSRQLVDHYEGSLILSRLEHVTLALMCLHSRETSQYLRGDHSYALMGLLRLRPQVDTTDSAFQAFARLSLANDSDMLLERLICTLPKSPNQHWSSMEDAWDAKLWDIYPTCQVAGVGHDDTVIIDGLRGASVRWGRFSRVANLTKVTLKRRILRKLIHWTPLLLILGALLCIFVFTMPIGIVMIIFALVISLCSPLALKRIYGGKFWYTQPILFGFEGHMDIETIERHIFGLALGRLTWSPYSSPLSRHQESKHGECFGIDPITDPAVARLVERGQYARPGDQRVFTIVDTGMMQVTLLQAARPPIAFLIGGEEGGMQRAIGVSYEWETATCYRETVMRMESPMSENMRKVPRVRFGLKRKMLPIRRALR